jgi:D-3-phosphoglycerate dehydrogenase
MTVNNKRVFYVKYLAHEIYIDILKSRADVRLDRLENDSPDAVAAPILSAAHAYQVGAARDEIARISMFTQDLLKRAPNLLIVSSNGAGFDPVDVDACTAAGVLVVNQSGGNAQFGRRACARDDADAVKAHSRGRPRAAPRGQCQSNALIGNEVQGKTVGIVGIGKRRPPHRRAVQGPAAYERDRLRSVSDRGRGSRRGVRKRSSFTI